MTPTERLAAVLAGRSRSTAHSAADAEREGHLILAALDAHRPDAAEELRREAAEVLVLLGLTAPPRELVEAIRAAEAEQAEYMEHGALEYVGDGKYERQGLKKSKWDAQHRAEVDAAYEAVGRAVMAQLAAKP